MVIKQKTQEERALKLPKINTLGFQVSGLIDLKAGKEVIANSFKVKYPNLVTTNLKAFERGYAEDNIRAFGYGGRFERESVKPHLRYLLELGYANEPLGRTIINPGNTVYKSSDWLGMIGKTRHLLKPEPFSPDQLEKTI
jgi:hypothetical protein